MSAELKTLETLASEKNAILDAVSWYDADAEKGIVKLSGDRLDHLLERPGCAENQLSDYGYFPTGKKDKYLQYETEFAAFLSPFPAFILFLPYKVLHVCT